MQWTSVVSRMLATLVVGSSLVGSVAAVEAKKIVFVAGTPSHGAGAHEHNAGCLLLAKELHQAMPHIECVVIQNGWPTDPAAFDGADAIVMYCDGGRGHMVNRHLDQVDKLVDKGVGIACIHYAVEVAAKPAGERFLKWIGGYFEQHWSVNPHWDADFTTLPDHPVTRGVRPFKINDEWYYHMRFRDGMDGVTPILSALPPARTISSRDGSHRGNPHVRRAVANGELQHVAWAYQRPDGGRGFGFTGGHFHWNWGDENFRKTVLNALVWIARDEVPDGGVSVRPMPREDLEANQDEVKTAAVRSPEPVVDKLDVAPGLKATLFAAEPMLCNPTNIDVDHRGRVWVCEVQNYRGRQGTRPEGDRILVLEDTDGDGTADKTTVFYQGKDIDSAVGMCVLGNRVIVSCAPNVFVFTDEDGDLKADTKELLFSNVGLQQHDHSTHAFVFGPDGRLYWNFGNTGKHVHDKDGKIVVDIAGREVRSEGKPWRQGMAFRCNLDGTEFEVVGHNFRNNYELAVDSFGTVWQSDNDDDGNRATRINYVLEHGNFGYVDEMTGAGWTADRTNLEQSVPERHWHQNDPGVVPNVLITGAGSPTGITIYEGELLPEPFRNGMIHCDAGPGVVRGYPVKHAGAGYATEMVTLLAGARDPWFRPSDVSVAPDGSLIVADWHDPGVGGHRMGDVERGRLVRIAPPGTPYTIPTFDSTTPEGAVAALQNPNNAVRYLAWTALHGMGAKAEPALLELYGSKNPRYRARALWLLGAIEGRSQKYVDMATSDADADIRITGLRLARQQKLDRAAIVKKLVRDVSPQVRREAALTLHGDHSAAAAELWAELAEQHDGCDRWYLEALGIGAAGNWDACLSAWMARVGDGWKTPAGRDIIWRSRAAQSLAFLVTLINDPNEATEQVPRYFRGLDFLQKSEEKNRVLVDLVLGPPRGDSARHALVVGEAIKRLENVKVADSPQYADALEGVLERLKGTSDFVRLVDRFTIESRYPELLALAQGSPDQQIGIDAIKTLLAKRQQPLILGGIDAGEPQAALATVQVLANSLDGRGTDILLAVTRDPKYPLDMRRHAARGVTKTRYGAQALLKLVEEKRIEPDLAAAVTVPLNAVPWRDLANQAATLLPLPVSSDDQPLPSLGSLLKMRGNAANGQKLFASTGTCANCHVVRGQGKEVGPDLSEIGAKLGREALYESILYPSAGISHNYETHVVILDSGTVVTGIIASQTDDELSIKAADALMRTFKKSEIEQMEKQNVSIMPADLQKVLSPQDLADVVEYLTTLRPSPK